MEKRRAVRIPKAENLPLELYCLSLANESARREMAQAGAELISLGRKLQAMARGAGARRSRSKGTLRAADRALDG